MPEVRQPADMNAAFAAAYNSGRIEELLALYEPEALLVGQGDARRHGLDAIRAELEGLLALGGHMVSTNLYALTVGDVSLLSAEFRLEARAPDGTPRIVEGRTAEVVRRQPDGRWLYLIDHPSGAGLGC
jgi:ketosteroid isomerase-like protein